MHSGFASGVEMSFWLWCLFSYSWIEIDGELWGKGCIFWKRILNLNLKFFSFYRLRIFLRERDVNPGLSVSLVVFFTYIKHEICVFWVLFWNSQRYTKSERMGHWGVLKLCFALFYWCPQVDLYWHLLMLPLQADPLHLAYLFAYSWCNAGLPFF